ncbi:hypothetical protein NSK11_contig00233-0001 [Nocardia seriolae]|nr:hypothetical protein NS14008_18620 [Nocardia seriolae]PSK26792.1 hypothetical protein C6575_35310 [Nocardia seriolae]BEK88439.1 hypothetical protein NSERKGN1266_43900 [Nocardia seriolae]GAP33274.1 hypothetical protein NSK11_contig00233-0001 [Nocardia seriolae]GEM28830.1 hypothetical protein NS2_70690 [Nocardia seriolae NBRC 15557]
MGYNKFLKSKIENRKSKRGKREAVFGLSPDWLLHEGEVVADLIVLSHAEQFDRLVADCPQAAPNAVVAGDICFDRLRASRPLRASYRRALGLSAPQKLVVISSTWGPESLIAVAPDIPARLARELPVDEFRIMIAPHPNIRSEHSAWQVREYLAATRRAGVSVPEDVDAWQSAIVAADLVVGDHGSVPFYSTALGNPLLLATAPEHTVDPRSPIARLLRAAPRLDPSIGFEEQVRAAIDGHDPARYAAITALTTSEPDASAALLRSALYGVMGSSEPDEPPFLSALPLPAHRLDGPASHLVLTELGTDRTARVLRYPAERLRSGIATPRGAHLAVGTREPRQNWLELADILIGEPGPGTSQWITETLASLPGCAFAAAPVDAHGWLIGDAEGSRLRVSGSEQACRLFASVAYQLQVTGAEHEAALGEWTIECGGQDHRVLVESPAPDQADGSPSSSVRQRCASSPKPSCS